jgi:hypothetical protein
MRKILIVVLCILLAPVYIASTNAETGRVLLKENLGAGQSYNLLEKMDLRVVFGEGEEAITVNQSIGLGYRFTVLRRTPEGGLTSKIAFHSVYFENPGAFGPNHTYDSTDPFSLPDWNSLFYAYLVGHEIETRLDRYGKVLEIRLSEAYLDKISALLKTGGMAGDKKELREQITASLSEYLSPENDGVERGVFVEEPVGVGEVWEKLTQSENNNLKLSFQTAYTLKERRDGVTYMHCRSVVTAIANKSSSDSHEYTDIRGGTEGDLEIDEATGWVQRIRVRTAITGKVSDQKPPKTDADAKQQLEQERHDGSPFTIEGKFIRETSP